MPIYQIVKSEWEGGYDDSLDSICKALSKRVSSLLLDGWKCQGGICIISQDGTPIDAIQAMIYDC